jgi:hypothetical protein
MVQTRGSISLFTPTKGFGDPVEHAIAASNKVSAELQEKVLLGGDLSVLNPSERLVYYNAVCESLGLNPLTRPFEYIELNHKLVLYARKDCTDQLRTNRTIDVTIPSREVTGELIVVTARAKTMDGRTDESIGAVPRSKEDGEWRTGQNGKRFFVGKGTYSPLGPEEMANAMMKAETKAKRRVTLSICGLGVLDEIEVDDVIEPVTVNAVYANKRDARTKIGELMQEQTARTKIGELAQRQGINAQVGDAAIDMLARQEDGVEANRQSPDPASHDAPASSYILKVGRQKGQPISDQSDDNLGWAYSYYSSKLKDQPDSKYRDEWELALAEIEQEQKRRG